MGEGDVLDAQTGTFLVEGKLQHRKEPRFIFSRDGAALLVIAQGRNDDWDEMQVVSTIDGNPLSPPMTNTRIREPDCAVNPAKNLVVAVGDSIRIWDVASGTMLSRAIDLDIGEGHGNTWGPQRSAIFSPNGRRIYIAVGPQLLCVRLDEIKRAIPPDDVLNAWAGVLSGERVDVLGGVVPMSAADYEKAWQTIRADAP